MIIKNNKKIPLELKKVLFLIVLTFILFSATIIFAQSDAIKSAGNGLDVTAQSAQLSKAGTDSPTLQQIILNITGYILSLIGIIFLILMILAGVQWMTAEGNDDAVKKAKATIKNSIIGLIVIGAAYVITITIFNLIGTNIGS